MKTCSRCKQLKPLDAFNRHRATRDNRQAYCRSCAHAIDRQRRRERPKRSAAELSRMRERYRRDPRIRQRITASSRERDTGCSPALYATLLAKQNGACAICFGIPGPGARELAADHDHATGRIRGLLCGRCNTGIGQLRDNISLLMNAIAYLAMEQRGWKRIEISIKDRDGNPVPMREFPQHPPPRTHVITSAARRRIRDDEQPDLFSADEWETA